MQVSCFRGTAKENWRCRSVLRDIVAVKVTAISAHGEFLEVALKEQD